MDREEQIRDDLNAVISLLADASERLSGAADRATQRGTVPRNATGFEAVLGEGRGSPLASDLKELAERARELYVHVTRVVARWDEAS